VTQSDWQATNKTRSWAALAAHVARYHLIMGLLLGVPVLRDGWPVWKALVVSVSGASHALIDRRWPGAGAAVRRSAANGSRRWSGA
jgi:hypothetical protein